MYVVLTKYHNTPDQEESVIPLSVCKYPYTAKRAVKYYALKKLKELEGGENKVEGVEGDRENLLIHEWDYIPSANFIGIYGKYHNIDQQYIDIIKIENPSLGFFNLLGNLFTHKSPESTILETIYYVEVPQFEPDRNDHLLISPIPKNPNLIAELRSAARFFP